MRFVVTLLALAALGSHSSECARILGLFIHPAISHFRFFQPVLRGLADVNHDVYVVSHFPEKNAPANYHDFMLDQSQIMTDSMSVDEVSEQFSFLAR